MYRSRPVWFPYADFFPQHSQHEQLPAISDSGASSAKGRPEVRPGNSMCEYIGCARQDRKPPRPELAIHKNLLDEAHCVVIDPRLKEGSFHLRRPLRQGLCHVLEKRREGVNNAAELPAAEHGVDEPRHEQAQSRRKAVINTRVGRTLIPTKARTPDIRSLHDDTGRQQRREVA